MNDTPSQPRLLTPDELAMLIKIWRELRQWSQETLAEIAGVNVRTIQRTESGKPASLHTRRAIAQAFDFEDIDLLSKPMHIPTENEHAAAKVEFEKNNITLQAFPISNGRQFAGLVQDSWGGITEPAFDLQPDTAEAFAEMADYVSDYRDCFEHYSEAAKIEVYRELEEYMALLKAQGVGMRYAFRDVEVRLGADNPESLAVKILYLIGFPVGKEPQQFASPKAWKIGC
ncbi:helix-turn-helix transcriptional regulator [Pseudomonas lundensis]|nr:helix-turn-helix transcriptional regulator [Pseudomonas lundensis]